MSDFFCPYPGLRPFEQEETDLFFGREEHSDQLIEKLGDTHFLAVLGPSGCGKSSLVRTGLLAGLETGFLASAGLEWRIADLCPGVDPFSNLAGALLKKAALDYQRHFSCEAEALAFLKAMLRRGPLGVHKILEYMPLPEDASLLLLVDQFEELFRYQQEDDIDETTAFIALLLEAGKQHSRVYVVITMRSEFLGKCVQFDKLPEAINRGLYLTPRLGRDQLQMAIEMPARVCHGQVEAELVTCLLNDMEDSDRDRLPVLQHVLMRMWTLKLTDRQKEASAADPVVLVMKDYEVLEGFEKILSAHADEAYSELTPDQKKIARILFCSLCERDPYSGRHDLRRPVTLNEVAELAGAPWEQVAAVAEVFRKEKRQFLTFRSSTDSGAAGIIDISHESLVHHWQRLGKWVKQETDSADMYCRLEESACRWKEREGALWQSPELENALAWRRENAPAAQWANRYGQHFDLAMHFLDRSEKEQQEKRNKAESMKRTRMWLHWASISLFVAIIIAAWGFWERNNALDAKREIEQIERIRASELFESQLTHAILLSYGEDYAAAKKLLRKSRELDAKVTPGRRHARNLSAWHSKLMGGGPQRKYRGAGIPLAAVAVSPDARMLAVAEKNGALVLLDAASGRLLHRLQGHVANVNDVLFHPQNKWLASAGSDERIIFWSLPEGERIAEWQAPAAVTALAMSPDGMFLAGGMDNNEALLWEAKTGKRVRAFENIGEWTAIVNDIEFSPDGEWLAMAINDSTVRLGEIGTDKEPHKLSEHAGGVESVAFTPDNTAIATGGIDKTVRLWNGNTRRTERVLRGHKNTVFEVTFVAEGRYLVSAGKDRTLRLWDSETGVVLRVLQGHGGSVVDIAYHADTGRIFSASDDATVMQWDISLPYQQAVDLPGQPASAAIAPDGRKAAVGFADGVIALYSLSAFEREAGSGTGKKAPRLLWEQLDAHTQDIQRLAFSPDGTLLASASLDHSAKLWRVTDGKLYGQPLTHRKGVNDVVFSADGEMLSTAGFDGDVCLLSLNGGQQRCYQPFEGRDVNSAAFDTDGSRLLTTGDYEVKLWDLGTDPPTLLVDYPPARDKLTWSVFSPDGNRIASVGRTIHIYSTMSKETEYRLASRETTIFRAVFSPDGRQIATAGADATLRFWDLHKEGRELFALRLPSASGEKVPLWDFDFRCAPQGCKAAIPLTHGKLMLYELGKIYNNPL